jgi:aryl-alcohol dehydrogenase-like predicted oxidoreductase
MERRVLGQTGLTISPLVFGGNVFGWTIDEKTSFALLDAFLDAGFNAIDTADVYTAWVPGHSGGESETVIGNWLRARPGARERVVIFTKVGSGLDGAPKPGGLSGRSIQESVEQSLRRLGVDAIDVYFSHYPDDTVPLAETLLAYQSLIDAGKIKAIGASNFDARRLSEALDVSLQEGLPSYGVLQPEYNLYTRRNFEENLLPFCLKQDIDVVPYYSLAAGFLTGKYRTEADFGKSVRGSRMSRYMDDRGKAVLRSLDRVAESGSATPAEIALAWLMAKDGVTAPIASATRIEQVEEFARAAHLRLTPHEMHDLDQAGHEPVS